MPEIPNEISFSIPIRGFFDSERPSSTPDGFAFAMRNCYPSRDGGITLRQGWGDQGVDPIISAWPSHQDGVVYLMRENGIHALDVSDGSQFSIPDTATLSQSVVGMTETTSRNLFFRGSAGKPFTIQRLAGDSYEVNDSLVFSNGNENTVGDDFSPNFNGAVAYQSRLYFWRESSDVLWYSAADAFMGDLKSIFVANVFGSTGALVGLGVLGQSYSGGEEAYLVAVMSDGDFILFSGIDPGSVSAWSAVARRRLPVGTVLSVREVGNDLFVTGTLGVSSVGEVMMQPSSAALIELAYPILRLYLRLLRTSGWESYGCAQHFILTSPAGEHLVFDTDTRAWWTLRVDAFKLAKVFYFAESLWAISDDRRLWRMNQRDDDGGTINAMIQLRSVSLGYAWIARWVTMHVRGSSGGGVIADYVVDDRWQGAATRLFDLDALRVFWSQIEGKSWTNWNSLGWGREYLSPVLKNGKVGYGTYFGLLVEIQAKNMAVPLSIQKFVISSK